VKKILFPRPVKGEVRRGFFQKKIPEYAKEEPPWDLPILYQTHTFESKI